MRLEVAKHAGFCFGVKRAIEMANRELETDAGGKLYSFGEIIHNEQVVSQLQKKGLFVAQDIAQVQCGDRIIIRSHGVAKHEIDKLVKNGLEYIDATCPYVHKIHNIVKEKHEQGYGIIIVGDKDHPEVVGINGWCDDSAIVIGDGSEDFSKISFGKKYCVVAQTTLNQEFWKKTIQKIKKLCTDVIFFDTICSATTQRQDEAKSLAQKCDIMVVIGGKHSSNTKKLVEVCKSYCKDVHHIETAKELPNFSGLDIDIKVGITAGASTPASIIQEVVFKMLQQEENMETMELTFEQELERTLKTLNSGDIVTGTVIGITPNEIYVNLNSKSDGYIPVSEFSDDPNVKIENTVKIGDEIEAFVVRINDLEGTIMLSKKKVASIQGWNSIETAYENKEIIEGKVVDIIKGGLVALCDGVRVFVPASQASDRFTADLSPLKGKVVQFRVIDIDKRRRRVVGSIRNVLEEQRVVLAAKIWAEIETGKKYTGIVKSLMSFGAFVDIGGVDGLIHISELSWNRVKHPSEVVNVGDAVEVHIIEADKEKNKIALGYRKAADSPWLKFAADHAKGDVVNCKIVRLAAFGAFAEIVPGVDGLIHISQIANMRITKPGDVLTIGQNVDAQIIEIDTDKQKISLSIRSLIKEEVPAAEGAESTEPQHKEEMGATIADAVN